MSKRKQPVGILNKGKNNSFINNEFHGFGVGIYDEGEKTLASGNSFFGEVKDVGFWKKYFWIPLLVAVIASLIAHFFTN